MENVIVLFDRPIQHDSLQEILKSFSIVTLSNESWEVRKRNLHVTLDLLPVAEVLREYETADLQRVIALLGGAPEFAISIAYRTGDASAEVAREIADALLSAGRSVIDHNFAGADGIRAATMPFV